MIQRACLSLSVLVLLAAAAQTAFRIEDRFAGVGMPMAHEDPLSHFLGSAREMLGDRIFVMADEYFHGGLESGLRAQLQEEGGFEAEAEGEDLSRLAGGDWIARLNSRIHVAEHRHLTGEEKKELLPIFSAATALDPYNTEAVLTTAYWLDRQIGKTDEAILVLEKGAKDNPGSWEIRFELASLYDKKKGDDRTAVHFYEEALEILGPDKEARRQKGIIQFHLGEAYLRLGENQRAREAFRQAEAFYDDSAHLPLYPLIRQRLDELRAADAKQA